ncbi:MAG: CapA family protein [Bacteroidetes bacterium]|nr:MAG: CapA family protein [Bacteroidota bacterium]
MKKKLTLTFVILFFITLSSALSQRRSRPDIPERKQVHLILPVVEILTPSGPGPSDMPDVWLTTDIITVIGVGDIMMGTDYPDKSYLPPNHGRDLLTPVHHILRNATLTFGNLEGVLLDGEGTVKRCRNPDLCYAFRSPEKYVYNLVEAGFDMVSLANNHTGDFGPEGRKSTVAALSEAGIAFAGTLDHPMTIVERKGIRFGMAAFAPNVGTVSIHDLANAQRIVRELKENADIVIVSFHGGAEGADHQNVTCETELYYGENRGNVCRFARSVIDAGADIVFGHGPHVTRSVDLYKDRFIAYSLGNFCTYARFNLRGENGIAPIIKVYTDREGKFIRAEATPVRQIGRGEPVIDRNNGAVRSLQRLLREDFPDSELVIYDNGLIERKKIIAAENP